MLDIGWTEIVVIAVAALVVLGPKELPRALKTIGAFMAKARSMAREFQSGVDEMIRESELDDLRKDLQNATRLDFDETPAKRIDPTSGKAADALPAAAAAEPAALPQPSTADPLPGAAAEAAPASETPASATPAISAPDSPAPDSPAPDSPAPDSAPPASPTPAGSGEAAETGPAQPDQPVTQVPASVYPKSTPAAGAAPAGLADAPPLGAQGFDRDYAGATEAQASGDFLPPEAGDGTTGEEATDRSPEGTARASARAAE